MKMIDFQLEQWRSALRKMTEEEYFVEVDRFYEFAEQEFTAWEKMKVIGMIKIVDEENLRRHDELKKKYNKFLLGE
jgi:hypothetical protein